MECKDTGQEWVVNSLLNPITFYKLWAQFELNKFNHKMFIHYLIYLKKSNFSICLVLIHLLSDISHQILAFYSALDKLLPIISWIHKHHPCQIWMQPVVKSWPQCSKLDVEILWLLSKASLKEITPKELEMIRTI